MPAFTLRTGLLGAALLVLGALPAFAQEADRIDRIAGGPPLGANASTSIRVVSPGALAFASFDRNSDGRITVAEIEAGALVAFAAADRNGDGFITGFEQADWAAAMGSTSDVLANTMTFDIDLDRQVTKTEFTAGLKRIAASIQPSGDLTFADLLLPLTRPSGDAGGPGFGLGTLKARGTAPGGVNPTTDNPPRQDQGRGP
jgi:hypothetical protein